MKNTQEQFRLKKVQNLLSSNILIWISNSNFYLKSALFIQWHQKNSRGTIFLVELVVVFSELC